MSNTERFDATQLPEENFDETSETLESSDMHEVEKSAESSRFKDGHFVQYPTGKPGHYSKDRRHVPITKKSDAKKQHICSGGGKGAKHKKAQQATL